MDELKSDNWSQGKTMGDPDDRTIWDALLKQAEANLKQAEANLATSSAIHFQTQRMVSKEGAADMELDRLESWYFADSDAEARASTAGQIVKQAEGLRQGEQQLGGTGTGPDQERQGLQQDGGIDGVGRTLQAVSPSIASRAVGTKRRSPSVLELLTTSSKASVQTLSGAEAGRGPSDSHPQASGAGFAESDEGQATQARAKPRPAGLIKTLEASGIEANAAGGRNAIDIQVSDLPAETHGPELLKTLAGTGLQANPRGGWTHTEPYKWAEIFSDGGDTGDDGCPKSGKPKLEEDRLRLEKLKLRICEFGGGQCVRAVKQMNLKPDAANIHGPEDRFRCGDCGGAVEKIACDSGYAGYFGCEGCDWVGEPSLPPPTKGKCKKGGRAGQQRARR